MNNEIFLIDANSLITPYLTFYSFDLAPGFWTQMEFNIKAGKIAILDMVKDEISKNEDALKEWFDSLDIANYIDHREASILSKYRSVLRHIHENLCYKPSALAEWAKASVADPWLIATAAVYGYTIITFETFNKGLNVRNMSKKAKIPNVADAFYVKTQNLYYLMQALKIKL